MDKELTMFGGVMIAALGAILIAENINSGMLLSVIGCFIIGYGMGVNGD